MTAFNHFTPRVQVQYFHTGTGKPRGNHMSSARWSHRHQTSFNTQKKAAHLVGGLVMRVVKQCWAAKTSLKDFDEIENKPGPCKE